LPLLLPSILTAFVLVFIYCFLSFGIVLVFGGAQFATLEVLIYRETYINLDLPDAAGIAAVQLLLSGLLIFTLTRVIGRSGVVRGTGARFVVRPFRSAAPITRIILGGYAAVLAVFLLGPLVGLIARSFADGGALSLENYRALFNPELSARDVESIIRSSVPGVILRSIGLALLSGTVTFVGAVLLAFSLRGRNTGASETIFQLPIGISTVTLAIGLRLSFGDLLPDLLVVVMGQVFITFPLVFRIVKTAVLDLPPDYLHSAESLGSSPFEALLRVGVPVLKRGLLNGYAYSLAIPFADFTIVLAATRGGLATFPVAIYRLIGFRSFDLALSMSGIYIAICLGLFLWIDTTSQRRRHRP
jgi:thiamine transport system permease protein